ncbi:potassium transporter [Betaproteobacteria bacterium LSUCC0115]|nr:potassium transporter [Burkholderiales bacterium LSUCC0115]
MESILSLIVALLAVSVGVVMAARAAKLPPLIGYLVVGVAFGPHALGVAPDTDVTLWLAEIGVVFLMFSIGVEFSLARLRAMKTLVLGLGSAQVLLTIAAVSGLSLALTPFHGMPWQASVVLGCALSMSSTAMVMRMASDRGELETAHGRPVVGVLLFQDLAVVPLMIIVPALAGVAAVSSGGSADVEMAQTLALALAKAVLVLVIMVVVGQRLVGPWLTLVARRKSQELFSLNLLLMTLGLAWVTEHLGLSLALGAFMAGMLISETEFRYQVEADIRPYRDVLMGLFFITVGMRLNLSVVMEQGWILLAVLLAYVAIKLAVIAGLARLFSIPPGPSLKAGLWLFQAGEFGFVLLDPSLIGGLLPDQVLQLVLAGMVISMLITPFVVDRSDGLVMRLARSEFLRRSLEIHRIASQAVSADKHLIICGYGRCGQNLAQLLDQEHIDYVALDLDPQRTREAAAAGHSVVFGDAARRETLMAAGIHRATSLVITYADRASATRVILAVRQLAPQLPIIVRARDDSDLTPLRDAGATEVVPEVIEGSLMLASHALALAGVPLHRVVRRVREVRDTRYGLFRGVFRGSDDDYLERVEDAIMLRTLVVPKASIMAGRPITDLGLTGLGVDIATLKRAGKRHPVAEDTLLLADDALVLRGTAEALAEAESLINAG